MVDADLQKCADRIRQESWRPHQQSLSTELENSDVGRQKPIQRDILTIDIFD